jgi:hypothetical protein
MNSNLHWIPLNRKCIEWVESEIRSRMNSVILSERGPKRSSVWGGESKDLQLFFNELLTQDTGEP